MRLSALMLFVVLLILVGLALHQGVATFQQATRASAQQLIKFLPILVIAMLIAGFTETLLPDDLIETWLSDASGWRGITVAWLAGIITPGGSIIGLPLIAALYKSGVGLAVLMTYATSFATLSLLRVPLEVGFYGWRITGIRILVTLILPFIAGGLTLLLKPVLESAK